MNRAWVTLIIIGIVSLILAIGWEAYQISTGIRSNIDTTVNEYSRNTLLTPKLEAHILADPKFVASYPVNQ